MTDLIFPTIALTFKLHLEGTHNRHQVKDGFSFLPAAQVWVELVEASFVLLKYQSPIVQNQMRFYPLISDSAEVATCHF